MASVEMKCELDPDRFSEALKNALAGDAFKPAKVVVGAPYAEAVEFGTGPARSDISSPKVMYTFDRADGNRYTTEATEAFINIYEWATRHCIGDDPYSFARTVYKNIMENGAPPRPYIRPALHEVEDDFQRIFVAKGSLKGVADELRDRIVANLETGGPMGGAESDTGALADSVTSDYCDPDELFVDSDIPEEVWADDYCDFNGEVRYR